MNRPNIPTATMANTFEATIFDPKLNGSSLQFSSKQAVQDSLSSQLLISLSLKSFRHPRDTILSEKTKSYSEFGDFKGWTISSHTWNHFITSSFVIWIAGSRTFSRKTHGIIQIATILPRRSAALKAWLLNDVSVIAVIRNTFFTLVGMFAVIFVISV